MKKIGLLISLFLVVMAIGKTAAQTPVCFSSTIVALDQNCSHTLLPEEVAQILPDCIVEIDRTQPFGDGPWDAPVLGPDDVNQVYQARVTHLPSGNSCTSLLEIQDKLPPVLICNDISLITLDGTGDPVTTPSANLNISAVDACGATALQPASVQYDCSDLGLHVVQLTATDESGNTSSCQHNVLVTNADNCQTCVGSCPESVFVTYDEGNFDLLPAFQNANEAVFAAFGSPFLEPTCFALDSFFFMDYNEGSAGYNWFTRNWLWFEASGQLVSCSQTIAFPLTHLVQVKGKVYFDESEDCIAAPSEPGVDFYYIEVTKLPSGEKDYFKPAPDGNYDTNIEFSAQDEGALVRLLLPTSATSGCATIMEIPNSTATPQHIFDIGLVSESDCPLMQVDLGALFTRRCTTNYLVVNYSNVGLDTAYNAYVTINLDSLITLQSANLPYTVSVPDSVYTFQLGTVPPFRSGSIYLTVFVSCDAVLNQTLCNDVSAYPNTPCSGEWAGPLVTTTARCEGDTVNLSVWNQGLEDMTAPLNYIVIEDFIMYKGGDFQLAAGDSMSIKAVANGATWRIEADQEPGFPVAQLTAAAVEGCGGLISTGLINAFFQSDDAVYYDRECLEVRGSFDPNDKTAVPGGYDDAHYIRANEQLEYQIRFQNTGNDTAFQVVIVDTLSTLLNPASLRAGAASHPYRLIVYPGGILHFVFQPIALPDSNTNEVASHGFVQFRIKQQPDLPDGTVIENTAAIYFDQNDPVITNTAFHTIGYPFVLVSNWEPAVPGLQVSVTPNPFQDQALLEVSGKTLQHGQLLLFDSQGRLLRTETLTDNRAVLLRNGLPAGTYFFQITERGAAVASGKMVAH